MSPRPSTARQIAANRRNAARSTGPKTAAGKAAAAGNARRHGLTAAPEHALIQAWYRIILDDPAAVFDPFDQDPLRRAAIALAQAEAQLQRVRLAEEEWLRTPEPDMSDIDAFHAESRQTMHDVAEEAGWDRRGRRLMERIATQERLERWKRLRQHQALGPTLSRYRSRAEARRLAALRRWVVAMSEFGETKPISRAGCSKGGFRVSH